MAPFLQFPTNCLRRRTALALCAVVLVCALGAGCCFNGRCLSGGCLPRIDPTGDHIFVHNNTPAITAVPPVVGGPLAPPPGAPIAPVAPLVLPPPPTAPIAAPALPLPPAAAALSPAQIVAPIRSEVLLIATVVDQNGNPLPRERVEWTIAQGGVGEFVSPGERGALDAYDLLRGLPKKVNGGYVVNSTVSRATVVDRGTPITADDVPISKGQSWVTLTSPVEGNTFVTAVSPAVKGWDKRQQTGSILWVDAQATFPPSTTGSTGGRVNLTTTVTRQSDGAPLVGWTVRYQITAGSDAGFTPEGGPLLESITNETGQATVELVQKSPVAGSNTPISIQVIRPASATGPAQPITVTTGGTTVTWTGAAVAGGTASGLDTTAPSIPGSGPIGSPPAGSVPSTAAPGIAIRVTGPAIAGVGALATYRIEVSNTGSTSLRDVVVADQPPAGLAFVNSNPAAESGTGGVEWRLGDISPQDRRVVESNYRIEQPGTFSYCASATTADGATAKNCANTVANPGKLDVAIRGPAAAEVGTDATFVIEITNRGDGPATDLTVRNRFDVGLEHASQSQTIEAQIPDLAVQQTRRVEVVLRVAQPGQLCQEVTVTAGNGASGAARQCLAGIARPASPAMADPAAPSAADTPTPAIAPTEQPPVSPPLVSPPVAEPPRAVAPPAGPAQLSVRKTGPDRRKVGESAEFVIEVNNVGASPLNNVVISDVYETSLEAIQASPDFQVLGGALTWTVPTLGPGQKETRRVNCRCLREATRACNRVTVTADGGTTGGDVACLEIMGEGVAAAPAEAAASKLSLSLADTSDPVRIGGDTVYQVAVTNNGAGAARQVALMVNLSPLMTLTKVEASPVRGTMFPRQVRFSPIAEIRPGETVTFELRARADRAGTATLHAELTSAQDQTPIAADETSQILAP